jgi:hypothetical protein
MIGLTGIAALEAEMRDRLADKNAEIDRLQEREKVLTEALRAVLDAAESGDEMKAVSLAEAALTEVS